ncbi:hypothetical protein TGGT1_310240 [Toxoplasma gondii GT1]|uniref:Transmembrane protein n=3 Tax=Toxoplasma gondii TaxID=5811 RepID=S7UT82_TOXGG|nr:hypothetical protein TGGT1_310240 [Toxoplasma gondii GT1]KAF4639204.1 hypothetical protein TGRH88_049760 [Toxoplasma gondii]PIL98190.1 putative transmembrane protein [Toxoplasma gondii COUG]
MDRQKCRSLLRWEGDAQRVPTSRLRALRLHRVSLLFLLSLLSLDSLSVFLAASLPYHSASEFLNMSREQRERHLPLFRDTDSPGSQHSDVFGAAGFTSDSEMERDKETGMERREQELDAERQSGSTALFGNSFHPETVELSPSTETPWDEADLSGAAPIALLQEKAWITKDYLQKEFMRKVAAQARARGEREEKQSDEHASHSGREEEDIDAAQATGEDAELAIFEGRGRRTWRSIFDTSESKGLEKTRHREAPRKEQEAIRGVPKKASTTKGDPTQKSGSLDLEASQNPGSASEAPPQPPLPPVSFLEYHPRPSVVNASVGPDRRHVRTVREHGVSSSPSASRPLKLSLSSPASHSSFLSSSSSPATTSSSPGRFAVLASHQDLSSGKSSASLRTLSTPGEASAVSHLQTKMQFVEQVLATALSGGASALAQGGGLPASGGVPMQQVTMAGMRPTVMAPADYGVVVQSQEMGSVEIALIVMGCFLGVGLIAGAIYFILSGGRRRRRR